MTSKFFLGDIVTFKSGKTSVEAKVIDLEWLEESRTFMYTIQAKDFSEYRVGQSAVKRVPDCKRKEKW